jgi:drug/metabolite transporter (DMT)-like permease
MMNNPSGMKKSKYINEAALLFMTLIWGATFVIVKQSLNDASSMLFIAMRFSLAGIILFFILLYRKQKLIKEAIVPGIILGVILFFSFATQTIGLKYTSATKSGFITGSCVVMIPIFQMIIEKKTPRKGVSIGAVIVFIGILFLSSRGNSLANLLKEVGANFNFGDGMTLLCAVFCAIYIVAIDIIAPKYNFWMLLFAQIVVVAILSLIAALIFKAATIESMRINFTPYLIFGVLYTGILATLLTTAIQTKYQKFVSPAKAGIIYSFEPVFAATYAFFLLNEKMSNFGLFGCALIFLGLIVSEVFNSNFSSKGKLNGTG